MPSQTSRGRWDRMTAVEQFDYVVGLEAQLQKGGRMKLPDKPELAFLVLSAYILLAFALAAGLGTLIGWLT